MNNKNIIIAGVIAIGLYLFSQMKKILPGADAQKKRNMTPAIRKVIRKKAPPYKVPSYKAPPQKTKFDYIRERTPPTLATTIAKRTGTPVNEARRIAEKIAYERARKQRERILAAHRAVLERARRKRIQIAAANRKAAARKNLIHRAVEVLPGISLHNLLHTLKPPFIKKALQKTAVLRPTPHPGLITRPREIQKRLTALLKKRRGRGTAHSNWAPHPWPVHIVPKKSTLFNYSKPQRKIDLSVLHTPIKWRRAITSPKPKSRLPRPVKLPFEWWAQRPFSEWRKSRRWPHRILRRR